MIYLIFASRGCPDCHSFASELDHSEFYRENSSTLKPSFLKVGEKGRLVIIVGSSVWSFSDLSKKVIKFCLKWKQDGIENSSDKAVP